MISTLYSSGLRDPERCWTCQSHGKERDQDSRQSVVYESNCILGNTVLFYVFASLCDVWLSGSRWIPYLVLRSVGAAWQVTEPSGVPVCAVMEGE